MRYKLTLGENLTQEKHPAIEVSDITNDAGILNKQIVNFFYLLQEQIKQDTDGSFADPPLAYTSDLSKRPYTGAAGVLAVYDDIGVILLDYVTGGLIGEDQLKFGMSSLPANGFEGVAVYRREIWYNYDPFAKDPASTLDLSYDGEPVYHLVAKNTDAAALADYNVGNNRNYEYLYRFIYMTGDNQETSSFKEILQPIQIKWTGWTLSDLHEVDGSNGTAYTTSLRDTWKFKLNISPGQQTQTLSRTQQDTIGRFPRFSQGLTNAISGQVQCLLGRDVLPAIYTTQTYKPVITQSETGGIVREWVPTQPEFPGGSLIWQGGKNIGGYQERLLQSVRNSYADSTSNLSVDMLDKWREFCYSGNAKLLRDAKGQRFIVQLTDMSNTTQENWNQRPEEISFSWVQIADADNVTIIEGV